MKNTTCVPSDKQKICIHAAAVYTEKTAHNFVNVVGEWKCKTDNLMAELDACRSEDCNYNSKVLHLKAAHDELVEQLDVVRRKKNSLADEIKELLDQLCDGERSIY